VAGEHVAPESRHGGGWLGLTWTARLSAACCCQQDQEPDACGLAYHHRLTAAAAACSTPAALLQLFAAIGWFAGTAFETGYRADERVNGLDLTIRQILKVGPRHDLE